MGRPAKAESDKMRSFSVRLAPRDMTRMLRILAHVRNREEQELIRMLLDLPLERLYEQARNGTDLPVRSALAMMTDQAFERLVKKIGAPASSKDSEPAPRRGGVGRLVRAAA